AAGPRTSARCRRYRPRGRSRGRRRWGPRRSPSRPRLRSRCPPWCRAALAPRQPPAPAARRAPCPRRTRAAARRRRRRRRRRPRSTERCSAWVSVSSRRCEGQSALRAVQTRRREGMLRCKGRHQSGGYACSTGVTIARVALERSAAARAVAGGARQPGAALGAELGIGLGAGTVLGTSGKRDTGNGRRRCTHVSRFPFLASRVFRPQRGERFRGVLGFERFVVAVREFSRRAIEFDLFQRPERDGLGREVVVGILSLIRALSPVPRPASLRPRTENWLQYEVDPARGEQDPSRELEQVSLEGSFLSYRCRSGTCSRQV